MVRHNNMIPNGHFHKKWQRRVKTWFGQPMKKVRRHDFRNRKLKLTAPKPVEMLRPAVRCPSVRYHTKMRAGRGFTLQELKRAAIGHRYARSVGIAVDPRRRNRCLESLALNAMRLKIYQSKLILLPAKKKSDVIVAVDSGETLNRIVQPEQKFKARKVTDEDRKFCAFAHLRKARNESKRLRRKLKKKAEEDGKAFA